MEPEDLLQYLQAPAVEPHESNPQLHTQFP